MKPDRPAQALDSGVDADDLCPQCGASSVTTFYHHDTFNYGTGDSAVELHVELPVRRCAACEFEFLDHEGERLRHEAVCRHLGVLSPAEVRAIRKQHGMTRSAFAQATGLGEATLNRWENGVVVQNLANDRYLRLLVRPGLLSTLNELCGTDSTPHPLVFKPRFRVLTVAEQESHRKARFELRKAS